MRENFPISGNLAEGDRPIITEKGISKRSALGRTETD
jgi:hypothetical protein